QQRVDYGKEVEGYTEYALAVTAAQTSQPAETVALVDMLLAQNPKSKYVDLCAGSYLAALGKTGGSAKQLEGMTKVAAGRPDNEVALGALAEGYASKSPDRALSYANRLVNAMKTKAKPEGVSDAEWERSKNAGLATGYYIAGMIHGSKQSWVECDRDLRAALPLISGDKARLGGAYFYLGLSNYQYGKLIRDRNRMQQGLKYSQESAALPGPMQQSAYRNVNAIQAELSGRR
ncbi:MAG: hypothetical protein ACRD30_04025, partial [Bryobacteraceae bacterium]